MDIFRISFFDKFECLAGDCPETCCKGFSIPVEEKAYEKLRAQGGLQGLKARLCISGAEGDRLLNRSRRKCPYLQKDLLCALQVVGFGDFGDERRSALKPKSGSPFSGFGDFGDERRSALKPKSGSPFSVFGDFGDDRRSALKPKSGSPFSGFGVLQPHACKVYPRRRQNFGLLAEETLDLSCPEAARLFFKADFPLTQSHIKGDVSYGRSGNNDDEAFLKELLLSREELIRFLSASVDRTESKTVGMKADAIAGMSGSAENTTESEACNKKDGEEIKSMPSPQELSRRFAVLLSAAERMQERCTHGEAEIFAGLKESVATPYNSRIRVDGDDGNRAEKSSVKSDTSFIKTNQSSIRTDNITEKMSGDEKETDSLFPLGIPIINEWVNGDIYNEDLLFRMPLLYEVCRLYFKRFDKLNESSGQIRLNELYGNYFKKNGQDVRLYVKYACYYLYRFYTDTYEDYSFVRRIRDMVMHTNLLLLLNALYQDEYGDVPDYIKTRLLASYEKRAFHSFGLRKSMYKKWAAYSEADATVIEKSL